MINVKFLKMVQCKIEKTYKVKVDIVKGKLIVNIPNGLGFGSAMDRIEFVEELTNKIVDDIRQYKCVFDVQCDIVYEFVQITFIG